MPERKWTRSPPRERASKQRPKQDQKHATPQQEPGT